MRTNNSDEHFNFEARKTGLDTWIPADPLGETVSQVVSRVNQDTPTMPGPSGSSETSFSGFPTLSSASKTEFKPIFGRQTPHGDARFAISACAVLPSNISGGSKKLLYELITRPQHDVHQGVSLIAISNITGLPRNLLGQYAKELERIGRAKNGSGACWLPICPPAAR
jgi:hypothetical protein